MTIMDENVILDEGNESIIIIVLWALEPLSIVRPILHHCLAELGNFQTLMAFIGLLDFDVIWSWS